MAKNTSRTSSTPSTIAIFFFQTLPFLLLLLPLPLATSLSFTYPNFTPTTTKSINYQGEATLVDGAIHLTSSSANSSGRAVYAESVPVWDSLTRNLTDFTTSFSFVVGGGAADADGLAFFLSPYPLVPPENTGGSYVDLFGGSLDTIRSAKIIAVEFDASGASPQTDATNVMGINNFSVTTVTLNTSITQGVTADAWVVYNSSSKKLSVRVSYPPEAIGRKNLSISHIVDLREALPSDVAVGFSAAERSAAATPHRVLSWKFTSTLEKSQVTKKATKGLAIGLAAGLASLLLFLILSCVLWRRRIARKKAEDPAAAIDLSIDAAFDRGAGPRGFSYAQLSRATRNFAEERKLGSGGFGEVYKGVLSQPHELEVAIKRVSSTSRQGRREYISEVTIISRLRHRNLVQLIGYCHEKGDLLLVYEFMANGSVDMHLYDDARLLRWPERYKIVVGLATALLYLHEECEQVVVHRDIKPSNVMLDAEFNPKLGDFGLARLIDHDRGSLTTRLAGTFGYIAPEYGASGKASKESDIYSFGVMTLETISGRKPVTARKGAGEADLVPWVWELYGASSQFAAVDERLRSDFDPVRMERLIGVGLWCAHPDCTQRPSIRQVINALNFDAALPELPPKMPVPTYLQPPSTSPEPASESFNSCPPVSNTALLGR